MRDFCLKVNQILFLMVSQKYNVTYCFLDNVLNSWQQRKLECSILYTCTWPIHVSLHFPFTEWRINHWFKLSSNFMVDSDIYVKKVNNIREGWIIWSKLNTFDTSIIYYIYNIQEQIKIQSEPAISVLPWNGIQINMATQQNPWE